MSLSIKVTEGPTCPKCGGAEVLLDGPVRPYKIDVGDGWESNCTNCDLWFLDTDKFENGVLIRNGDESC